MSGVVTPSSDGEESTHLAALFAGKEQVRARRFGGALRWVFHSCQHAVEFAGAKPPSAQTADKLKQHRWPAGEWVERAGDLAEKNAAFAN